MSKEEAKCQPVVMLATTTASKSVPSQPAINFIIYVLCIASLGAAVYSNVLLRTHDERIRTIEAILRDSGGGGGGLQFSPSQDVVVAGLSPDLLINTSAEEVNYANLKTDKINNEDTEEQQQQTGRKWFSREASEELLERLQHQVAGIQQRLRRDVSQLQLIRPQRQTSDCLCPAGECNLWSAVPGERSSGRQAGRQTGRMMKRSVNLTLRGRKTEGAGKLRSGISITQTASLSGCNGCSAMSVQSVDTGKRLSTS